MWFGGCDCLRLLWLLLLGICVWVLTLVVLYVFSCSGVWVAMGLGWLFVLVLSFGILLL